MIGLLQLCLALIIGGAPRSAGAADGPGFLGVGYYHNCRVRDDASLGCWGYNGYGQATSPAGTFDSVSAGIYNTCGLQTDGALACWGENSFGQSTPPIGEFSSVSSGTWFGCGVRADSTLACWGLSAYGQANPPPGSFASVSSSVGGDHACGVRSNGTLTCWGDNGQGQSTPPLGTFSAVTVGNTHSCGLHSSGTIVCWGFDYLGVASPPSGTFTAVDAGNYHNCAVRTDGTLACWGNNGSGQSNPPVGTFLSVGAGASHSCGVRTDYTLTCWGDNFLGQAPSLGLTPTDLPSGSTSESFAQVLVLSDPTNAYIPPAAGFAVVSGSLPIGLTLSAEGTLSGTPLVGGAFTFAIEGEDANGFSAQHSYTVLVDGPTDNTPPLISPSVLGTLGDNGWYTGDVTVGWAVSDGQSAVSTTAGCEPSTLSVDSAGITYSCTATSGGGTSTESVTMMRDATAPALAPTVAPAAILINGSGTAAANAIDSLSGVMTQGCDAVDASTIGTHEVNCTATDAAGNTAVATAAYLVVYGFIGFSSPVDNPNVLNFANAGQAIPFKWRLVDANGAPITTLDGVSLSVSSMSCDGSLLPDEVEQYEAAGTGYQNKGNGDYQYNWRSPKSYEGSCKTVTIDLGDGSTRFALFRFH